MALLYTEEQKELIKAVRDVAENQIKPHVAAADEAGKTPDELWKYGFDLGLHLVEIPEQYGGGGGGIMDTTIIAHEFAKGSASIATFMGGHWLAANLILENGTEEQRQKYMPEAVAGKIFAFGLTESSAGSDAAGIKSRAVETEDGWVLDGSKAWITNSGVADYYIILAMTDPELGTKGISAFLLDKDTEGLAVGKFEEKMGCRGSATCELAFNNIKLPKEALLGVRGKGFKMAMETLDIGRITAAAICAGISEHAMNLAKVYANERKAFGKPIKAFQGVAFRFADMYAEIKAMEFLAYDAAATKDAGKRCTLDAAAAKLFATEHAVQICIQAQQVFGGNGYSKEYDVERLIRDARGWCVMEGSTEILRMIVSGTVLA